MIIFRYKLVKMTDYIYLLTDKDFVNSGEEIHKIGIVSQENIRKRHRYYSNGSILHLQIKCIDCNLVKTQIIDLFTQKYTHRPDIDADYFEGNHKKMIDDIYHIVRNQ